jgi:hypothetical protein
MYCPKCGAEYKPGITVCADCDVPLVHELPEQEEKVQYVKYVELLVTFNPADVTIIKSILDDAGIHYFFKGEHFIMVRPLVDPARLMVKKDEVDKAKELLKDLNLKFMGISFPDEDTKKYKKE